MNSFLKECILKKLFLVILCTTVLWSGNNIYSQKNFFSIGGELSLPFGNLNDYASIGFGGSLRFEGSFGKHVDGTFTIGYTKYAAKQQDQGLISYKLSTLPIQGGIKYFLKEKKEIPAGVYFSGEAGLIVESTDRTYAADYQHHQSETGVGTAAGGGYQIGKLELCFQIQSFLTWEYGASFYYHLRIAYNFLRQKH